MVSVLYESADFKKSVVESLFKHALSAAVEGRTRRRPVCRQRHPVKVYCPICQKPLQQGIASGHKQEQVP